MLLLFLAAMTIRMPFSIAFSALVFLSFTQLGVAQKKLFNPPLEIPLYLAGNFGELRSNHFHAGLDIKTQGHEGMKVLAVADGYISRIKVSPFGYGLALYIRHPNGYTSVYGHLKKYNEEIQAFVKEQQYKNKSFKIELFPQASQFQVKQGDLVGISGNSGGSHAPHLHFEIRETVSESPVDPLQFGFDIKDNIKPILQKLFIYPASENSEVNGRRSKSNVAFVGGNGSFISNPKNTLTSSGSISFGIQLYDQLNEVPNHCGVKEIKLFKDNELIYHHIMDKVSFYETRYINAYVDFEEKKKNNTWVHRSTILPNNKLKIYKTRSDGIVAIAKGSTSHFRYEVIDFMGNKSVGSFEITGIGLSSTPNAQLDQKTYKRFKYNEVNTFETDEVLVYLPANILYEDLDFKFWKEDTIRNAVAPLYNIHDLFTPLQSYMALSFKLDKMEPKLRKYATIVSLDANKKILPEGGYWKGDYLIVKTRSFGPYTVLLDSIKPKLTPINIPSTYDMSKKWSIMIKAEDNLSGVHRYNGYIDGNWVLMEFDYKKKRLIHYFEDSLEKGSHHFKLIVKDKIGNESELEFDFTR